MEFVTIEKNTDAIVTEKKSKFIANLIYVQNKKDAEEKIKEIRKKYFDARHNCSAYRVIENGLIYEKSSDDGEPSGTAGAPMLGILQRNNLCNVLVVVTRYFGGVLLGTGGLVRCYSQSTIDAVDKSIKLKMCEGTEYKVKVKYEEIENFKYFCNKRDISIINIDYGENIICNIELENENKESFIKDIQEQKVKVLENKELCQRLIKKK